MRRGALAVALLGLASSCAASSAAVHEPEQASIEIGTGTWRFEPLVDGQEIPLVHGAQGGWHFWLAVRAHGITSDAGSLTFERQPADESAAPTTTSVGVHFDPEDAEGGRNYLGWPEILGSPGCAVGVLTRVHATLTLADGRTLEDEVFVTPTPGDVPPPACTVP